MKWFVRSAASLVVAAALAVPFVHQQGGPSLWGNSSESGEARKRSADVSSLPVQPAVNEPLAGRTRTVPDFADIYDVTERKREFFSYLLPAIEEVNQRITEQRDYLFGLDALRQAGEDLSASDQQWLDQMLAYYRVDEEETEQQLATLKRRVDIVPSTLVLIQAANESGWGTSRFATQGLNFFGQWCWTAGCGIVPASRPQGERYEVRQFDSMEASVESFIRNLNTHFAYVELRQMRQDERLAEDQVSSTTLTAGLLSYSERGQDYIDELNQMIRINQPIIEDVRQQTSETGIEADAVDS